MCGSTLKLFMKKIIEHKLHIFGVISLILILMGGYYFWNPGTSQVAAETYPIFSTKQYSYKAGDTIPSINNPVKDYLTTNTPVVPCTDKVVGPSDGCVPRYTFYRLANAYQFLGNPRVTQWYKTLNIPSLTFWGSAGDAYPNCDISNNPTTDSPTEAPELATAWGKTRVAYINGMSARWAPKTPTGYGCPSTKKGGDSYAIFTKGSDRSGVGLFTMSGKGFHDAFWRGFGINGQGGGGANKYISGTFFNFLQGPSLTDETTQLKPFSGASTDMNQKRVLLESTQSAYNVATHGDTTKVAQVQQYANFALLNKQCNTERNQTPSLVCQLIYTQESYVNRREYKDGKAIPTETLPWNNYAHYNFDPAQGGMPYVSGPLKTNGVATTINYLGKSYSLWTSRGSATKFESDLWAKADGQGLPVASFENLTFRTEITFGQFLTFLRILGADAYQKEKGTSIAPENVPADYLVSKFGSKWNDPNEWIIMRLGFAQEAVNPNQETESIYMGGNIKMINLQALP